MMVLSYQTYGDYCQPKFQTIPIHRIDFYQILQDIKISSKIDLFKENFQISIAEQHKCKIDTTTPSDLPEFYDISLGLKNALETL